MRVWTTGTLIVATLLGAAVAAGAPAASAGQEGTPAAERAAEAPIEGLETFEVASAAHTRETVDYPQNPPAGGPHDPVWQNCGFYEEPVRNEHAVHSQEHGAVWITYRPDLADEDLAPLRRLAERNDYVLVSPYPDLPAPVVASAWGAQLRLDDPHDPRLRQFVRLYAEQGPEPGAPCQGGTDETFLAPAATPAATPMGSAAG